MTWAVTYSGAWTALGFGAVVTFAIATWAGASSSVDQASGLGFMATFGGSTSSSHAVRCKAGCALPVCMTGSYALGTKSQLFSILAIHVVISRQMCASCNWRLVYPGARKPLGGLGSRLLRRSQSSGFCVVVTFAIATWAGASPDACRCRTRRRGHLARNRRPVKLVAALRNDALGVGTLLWPLCRGYSRRELWKPVCDTRRFQQWTL
jgi:hypothetical protein